MLDSFVGFGDEVGCWLKVVSWGSKKSDGDREIRWRGRRGWLAVFLGVDC